MKIPLLRAVGFTLIELMVVIAIIAIIVALAVPAYRDFTIRAKVAECVHAAAPYKISISEYRQTMGSFPPNMSQAGLPQYNQVTQYCRYFMYNNARGPQGDFAIEVDMVAIAPAISLPRLQLILSHVMNTSGAIQWYCTRGWGGPDSLKYMPKSCRRPNMYD